MKLYRISQDFNTDWYSYDSAVVVASSKEEARRIIPSPFYIYDKGFYYQYKNQEMAKEKIDPSWCHPNHVKAEEIGNTIRKTGEVVTASFNSGMDESRYLDMRRLGKSIASGQLTEVAIKKAIETLKAMEIQTHDRGLAELRHHFIEANRAHDLKKVQEYELKIRDYNNEEYEDWS